jgi:hypothetical protein
MHLRVALLRIGNVGVVRSFQLQMLILPTPFHARRQQVCCVPELRSKQILHREPVASCRETKGLSTHAY